MVLSGRVDVPLIYYAAIVFRWKKDDGQSFFLYDLALMHEETYDKKAKSLLPYLAGDAFSFYFKTYTNSGLDYRLPATTMM